MVVSLAQIVPWLLEYKYVLLFPIAALEGPIITIIAGFLSSLGYLQVVAAYATVVLGDLAGDSLYYAAGRWGGKRFVARWGRYVGITPRRVEQIENHFNSHMGKTLIVGKMAHAVGGVVLVAAGLVRVPYGEFLWFNFVGTVPKSLLFILIGFYFGQAYVTLNKYLDYTAVAMIVLALLGVSVYLLYKKINQRYEL